MNIQHVFPRKWLYPEDLNGRAVTVTIAGAAMVEVRNPASGRPEQKLAVSFAKATKQLIINKTQAYAIAQIAGSAETNDWPGARITLSGGIAPNGKMTIAVTPEPANTDGAEGDPE